MTKAFSGIYITPCIVSRASGGGQLAIHESAALKQFIADKKYPEPYGNLTYEQIFYSGEPSGRMLPLMGESFFLDYLVEDLTSDMTARLVHFYGTPYAHSCKHFKNSGAKIVNTMDPHDIVQSKSEHERFGLPWEYPHFNYPFLWVLNTMNSRESDLVIFPSKISHDFYVEAADMTNKTIIIPHGCDMPGTNSNVGAMKPIDNILPAMRVGYLGACTPDKGVYYLISAWEEFWNRHEFKEDDKHGLILAGVNFTEWINVHDRRRMKKHNSMIYQPGDLSTPDKLYNTISIYVQPAVTEAFGIAALEAMSYGRPVIVSEGAGISEYITDGKEGFIIPIRGKNAMVDIFDRLYDNPDLVKEMGNNAKETAAKMTWVEIEKQYIKAYESVM